MLADVVIQKVQIRRSEQDFGLQSQQRQQHQTPSDHAPDRDRPLQPRGAEVQPLGRAAALRNPETVPRDSHECCVGLRAGWWCERPRYQPSTS